LKSTNILDELRWRGLVYDASDGVAEHLRDEQATLYIGFDPTAASLHVGSLLQILALARMQRFGHRPIALVGGGTGMIGDPSGKTAERQLLTRDKVQENLAGIRSQLERFLDFDSKSNPARIVDNGEWLNSVSLIDFLREIGKHFTVNYMVAKDSVKRRMEGEDGISFTEFSYLLLQSYDYLVLHDRFGCSLQMGGSDQWGNITAGTELIRKLRHKKAYGIVSPLVTSANGVKFGKTESGTIWFDANLTSPYQFYHFWFNTTDADVMTYLRYFTFLEQNEIEELGVAHAAAPHERRAQKRLAAEVTAMVHGGSALDLAEKSSQVLFQGDLGAVSVDQLFEVFADVPSSTIDRDSLAGGLPVTELFVRTGLCASKGAARRLLSEGGVYVNNMRIGDERATVSAATLLEGRLLVLRKGRKDYHLVKLGATS
jgi:tyrosyl-tRNA synthetase